MRILLADDHPMIRAAIDVLLRDTGYEVVGMAGTGQAALEVLNQIQPDILLLDIQMPGGSGLDVLRQLRADKSPVKVIILTAAVDDAALLEAKALKVRGIVLKNSDPAYLLECL
ncbi:MAG TPA: response regulator transcription factor, partial [Sphingomicrobium sp.]|nr:response regulator transcription factor [Sphingomicrobium sp.]